MSKKERGLKEDGLMRLRMNLAGKRLWEATRVARGLLCVVFDYGAVCVRVVGDEYRLLFLCRHRDTNNHLQHRCKAVIALHQR